MSAVLAPDRILKELADLWVSLGKQGDAEHGVGVLRACSMTLVVLAEESDDASALGETLAALMPEHPARTMVVRLQGGGERVLGDRVYAQCWMPFGQRRQICCEQVEITASDAALGDLPSVVLPLAVPDLPLIVWCRSARLLAMPDFHDIAAMAGKVVIDSAEMPDGLAALRKLAGAAERNVLLGDLAWTRLTRWREMLSQVFENRAYLDQLPGVQNVRVSFGAKLETSAWYMAAWLQNALAQAGVHPKVAVEGTPGSTEPLRVELTGTALAVELIREANRLVVTVNGLSHCTSLTEPNDYLLMREELSIVHHDPVFEAALATAAGLV
ncbi:MAG TPA: glucose-6-phosphate dehydrogenase assembly protein OpcA [Bryobacteraceae bacterium]|nr:glucose-6-phosphate dehydrogenase assembly protein OpcA [Bryobacteraceae bacterium]